MLNKDKPLVTIAIPTCNRAKTYLVKSLKSAINQTYSNIQIIVSDNCSSDNTEEVVKNFHDSRIEYFKQSENIGPVENTIFCIEKARGVYFLLLHDDDMVDEDFIATCMEAANYSSNVGIIRTGIRVIDGHGQVLSESLNKVKGLSLEDFFKGWIVGKTAWYLPNTLFNTNGLRETGGFRSKYSLVDDGIAISNLAYIYGRIDIEDIKASFRKHGNQITFQTNVMEWCDAYLFLLDRMCEIIKDDGNFRLEGMRFFCRLNYNRASHIKSYTKRLITYLKVYKKFKYVYSPVPYM